tara:strand:- start:34781 stop:45742 length:10962 start_codon:yes stop_codon:yes gene_type:complete
MKTDHITRFASLLLVFFFLSNDLVASARALANWKHLQIGTSAKEVLSPKYPSLINAPAVHENEAEAGESPTKTSVALKPTLDKNTIEFPAIEATAHLGMEVNMPLNDPRDDIFNFQLPEDLDFNNWTSAYLIYEVKGLKDGKGLAKSLNSNETFGTRNLEKSETWHTVLEKVSPQDLKVGLNYLRFTMPSATGISAEVKNVKIRLSALPDNEIQSPRLERIKTTDLDYFKSIPALDEGYAYQLREVEMPVLPEGLINITGGAKAYQPSMDVVNSAEFIGFKINMASLTSQRSLSELQVFYFDYQRKAWQGVEIDSIDTHGEIAFVPNKGQTQYFGALLKSPEMPEASAFAPTMIQGIEAANPAEGMNIMQPPSISRKGEANITYPLDIPSGRKGMQPNLALSYNSDGGSSWAGYGWDISISSISVDTKWGAPVFKSSEQSEMYIMDGNPLIEEGGERANRSVSARKVTGTTYFFTKRATTFNKVVRKGTDPTNYYWEVTNAEGVKFIYGKYSQSYTFDKGEGSRPLKNHEPLLRDADSNIVKWGLTEVLDVDGNNVVYSYSKQYIINPNTVQTPALLAYSWYPNSIFYTGSGNRLGHYMIDFEADIERVDARLSGRYGIKVLDHKLLKNVKVRFKEEGSATYSTILKSYGLTHTNEQEGNLWQWKSMLLELKEFRGTNLQLFTTHEMEYYPSDVTFTAPTEKTEIEVNSLNNSFLGSVALDAVARMPTTASLGRIFAPSPLGSKNTSTHSFHANPGIGIVPGVYVTPDKNFTFSVKVGGSNSTTNVQTSWQDVDADGLPDLITKERRQGKDKLYYQPLRSNSNMYFLGSRRTINTSEISSTHRADFNIGFESLVNLYAFQASYGLNWNDHSTYTDSYLIDYNADGVLDLVKKSIGNKTFVHFGSLDELGNLSFEIGSGNSLSPTLQVGPRPLITDDPVDAKMGSEIVRIWEAPESGIIDITGQANLTNDADGEVEIAIQYNNTYLTGGFSTINSTNPTSASYPNLAVTKGDKIMFRVRSGLDSYEDLIEWDPRIFYTSSANLIEQLDGAGNELLNTSASDGFLLSGGEAIVVKGDNSVKIDWPSIALDGFSDDIQFRIRIEAYDRLNTSDTTAIFRETYVNSVNTLQGSKVISASPSDFSGLNLNSNILNQLGQQFVPFEFLDSYDETQLQGITINLRFGIFSTSNVKWNDVNLDWRPEVTITSEGCGLGESQVFYPTINYQTYNHFVETMEPESFNGFAGLHRVWPTFPSQGIIASAFSNIGNQSLSAFLTVKSNETLVTKAKVVFKQNGLVDVFSTNSGGESINQIFSSTALQDYFSFLPEELLNTEEVYLEWFSSSEILVPLLQATRLNLISIASGSVVKGNLNDQIFNRKKSLLNDHWLHWGRFMWNDLDMQTNNPIDPLDLKLQTESIALANDLSELEDPTESSDISSLFNTQNEPEIKFLPLIAVRGELSTSIRNYIKTNVNVTSNGAKSLDRFSALNSHSAEYRVTGIVAPWHLVEPDLEITPSSNSPILPDMVPAMRNKTTSYTLADNFYAGVNGLGENGNFGVSRHIDDAGFFNTSETFMKDFNGDGHPDIWQSDDVAIVFSDSRGGYQNGLVPISQGPKTDSRNLFSASVGLGATINMHPTVINFDDEQDSSPLINGQINKGMSISKSIGQTTVDMQWVDINGDGLPDRIVENTNYSNGNILVRYNIGTSLAAGEALIQTYRNTLEQNASTSLSFPTNFKANKLTNVTVNALDSEKTTELPMDGSFNFGVGINRTSSHAESFFIDINGDGLVDRVIEKNLVKGYDIFLNKGLEFSNDPITLSVVPDYFNSTNSVALNIGGAATVGIPLATILLTTLKGTIGGGYTYAYSSDLSSSSFSDVNGDGYIDFLKTDFNEDLEVYINKNGKSLKLKKIINPLGGAFAIDYDFIGHKNGYYAAEVKAPAGFGMDSEEVLWDMPQSKWVMSKLEIFDGYDLVENGNDLDGNDCQKYTYHYDAGIYSRREREFLGFTRTEKRTEALRIPFKDINSLKDIRDPSFDPNCYYLDNNETYAERYYSELAFYESLYERDFNSRKIFEYKNGVLLEKAKTLNYSVHQSWKLDIGSSCSSTLHPITQIDRSTHLIHREELRYNYYSVSQSASTAGEIERDVNDDLLLVDFSNISELASVFPAVKKSLNYFYPEIDTSEAFHNTSQNPQAGLFLQAKVNSITKYDRYFNILQSTIGAANTDNQFVLSLKKTVNYNKVVEFPSTVNVKFSGAPLQFLITNPHGSSTLIPGIKNDFEVYELDGPPGFDNDTLFLPLSLLETSDCGISPELDELGVDVPITFRKVDRKEIKIYEANLSKPVDVDLIADMNYHAPVIASGKTAVLSDHEIRMNSSTNPPVRKTTSTITPKGHLKNIVNHLVSSSLTATTSLLYNIYGQVVKVTGPSNYWNQRMEIDYNYDSYLNQNIINISNSYGESICNIYSEEGNNLLLQTSDINNHIVRYKYDEFNRLKVVYGPREIYTANAKPAIIFEYYNLGIDLGQSSALERKVPVAFTYHNINASRSAPPPVAALDCNVLYDLTGRSENPSSLTSPLRTATFIDGSGEVIQVKKDVSWSNAASYASNIEVSGIVTKNLYGWKTLNRLSFLDLAAGETTPVSFGELIIEDSQKSASTKFDYLGRASAVKLPSEGSSVPQVLTEFKYKWNGSTTSPLFYSETLAPNDLDARSYSDAFGRQIEAWQGNDNSGWEITKFSYDKLGQLLEYVSPAAALTIPTPASDITSYTYDEFGRVLTETHTDRGLTTNTYDLSGNLLKVTNNASEDIDMTYDYNRLTLKEFSNTGGVNNVSFTYGSLGDGKNGAGRVVQIQQGSNFIIQDYKYDFLGNLIEEKKNIRIPQAGPQEFTTNFNYDSWGRILDMTYPDDEVVTYGYNLTGDLNSMQGERAGYSPHDILNSALYDGFGNMKSYEFGNRAETNLSYNNNTRRLTNSDVNLTFGGTTQTLLAKSFQYDGNGNITEVSNTAVPIVISNSAPIGGSYKLDGIAYNNLNQLENARLRYSRNSSGLANPDIDQTIVTNFNTAGRLASKTTTDNATGVNGTVLSDLNYTYGNSAKKHQLTSISDQGSVNSIKNYSYNYNAMGSIIEETYTEINSGNTTVNQKTSYCWTEDQKLNGVLIEDLKTGFTTAHHYLYDHTGNRVMKSNIYSGLVNVNSNSTVAIPMDPSTVYVSPYYIALHYLETVLASKHYYMGTQRIATNLISYPFDHENPALEPIPATEGEVGYTNQNAGAPQDLMATLRCLYDDQALTFTTDFLYLQSIGQSPEFLERCPDFDDSQDLCLCEQSVYFAGLNGANCNNVEILYFYHPDYLGSVEFITDMRGEPYQFFLNTPWGENLENQYAKSYTSFSSRFRFNGKEWDEETGLFYYGARYYDPKVSVWLSVDAMASKGPNITPYAFSHNNPVMLVDPDGNWPNPVFWAMMKVKYEIWKNNLAGATKRLATGNSGHIPSSAPVPQSVRNQVKQQATRQDATTVVQGAIDVVEGAGTAVGMIPGVETVADGVGLLYNIVKGDAEGVATYSLALAVPGVSANMIKLGKGGYKVATMLLKNSTDGMLPVPMVNGKLQDGFTKMKGNQGFRHDDTGAIYKKSNTTHGSQTGTQWKAYPKGTTDFSKNSGNRVTIDGDGTLIGN